MNRSVLTLSFLLLVHASTPVGANEPTALNDYAVQLINKGEYDKALEYLQRAFSLNSYDPDLKRNLAEAYVYVGRRHLDKNEYEEAASYIDNARELFPDDPRFATLRGISLFLAKQYDAAIVELERALAINGANVEALCFLGRSRYDNNDISGALEAWEKASVLDPGNKNLKQMIGKARREEAVERTMEKGYSSRFSITYDTGVKSQLADSILDTLESAYNGTGSNLGHFPAARVPVILYTKKDFRIVTEGPDWSGGVYDGKIRLPIGGATVINEWLRAVLLHEYAHVVVKELTYGNCPTWLNEGIAENEGRKEKNPPLHELPKAVKDGGLHSLAELSGAFTGFTGKEAVLAYEESYSVVAYLLSTYGWHMVRDILVNLGTGMQVPEAVEKGLGNVGITLKQVESDWRGHLKKIAW